MGNATPIPLAQRFLAKINTDGPTVRAELGPCHLWTGTRNQEPSGYGRIRIGGRDGYMELAHRVAWEFEEGPIPAGMFVLHRCDNPPCVRRSHLFLGSHAANMADCAAKGRTKKQRGSRHAMTKLTEVDVVAMRMAWSRGELLRAIAGRYGIRKSTASYIVNGHTWTHVAMPEGRTA